MVYNDETIGEIERHCPAAEKVLLGTKIDTLYANLKSNPREKYNGDLLTEAQVLTLNNMCCAANQLNLGTLFNNLLAASKNETTIEQITDAVKDKINNGIDDAYHNTLMGNKISEMIDIINDMSDQEAAEILTFSIPEQEGESTIDSLLSSVVLNVPSGTDLTNLVATFALSEDAIAEIEGVEQSSGETQNDFTDSVIYTIIAEDGVTTKNWTVSVLELEEE